MTPEPGQSTLLVLGLSHKTTPLNLRERLALTGAALDQRYHEWQHSDLLDGFFILSTCNRVEIYVETVDPKAARDFLLQHCVQLMGLNGAAAAGYFYDYHGAQATQHLFCVTAGLDSMIVGEPQITGQVKEAYARAVKFGTSSPLLNRLAQRAFAVAKRVRNETELGCQPVSVPYTAVLLAEQIFGDLKGKTVLLVGTGEMSELAATHLSERAIGRLLITNRSAERGQDLAARFQGSFIEFAHFPAALSEADIVLSSTSAPEPIVNRNMVHAAMQKRGQAPMFFIDIGVPRDVDATVNELENVYLFDIDDLQRVVDENLEERERAARNAKQVVIQAVASVEDYLREQDLSGFIRTFNAQVEQWWEEEWRRYESDLGALGEAQRESLGRLRRGLLKKVLHEPIQWLKKPNNHYTTHERSEILRRIFRLSAKK